MARGQMLVEMLETTAGTPDGMKTLRYDKGKQYNMPRGLALIMIKRKSAKLVAQEQTVMVAAKQEVEAAPAASTEAAPSVENVVIADPEEVSVTPDLGKESVKDRDDATSVVTAYPDIPKEPEKPAAKKPRQKRGFKAES